MSNVIYSSEHGRICPKCGKPEKKCTCSTVSYAPHPDGIVKVRRETSGRRGKAVITIRDIPGTLDEVKILSKELKSQLGSGGSFKNGVVEIQGEKLQEVVAFFRKKGYTVKQIGG